MSKDSFDFEAGDVCLDFANTNDWHASDHPIESLHNYVDLVGWAKAAGLLSPGEDSRLLKLAQEQPALAKQTFDNAIQIREAIYRIFSNRYARQPIAEEDLATLNLIVREALAHRQLVPQKLELEWDWTENCNDASLILWKVGLSAAELLTSYKARRVRVCEDDRGCGYLFIDVSKNHSRRWCSMESCGNRAKARRHYSRVRKED